MKISPSGRDKRHYLNLLIAPSTIMAKKLKLWFDIDLAKDLEKKIIKVESSFNNKQFLKEVKSQIEPLELKPRIKVFGDAIHNNLPGNYKSKITTLLKILGPENPNETGMFKEYYWILPIAQIVEDHGLDDFKLSTDAMKEITKRSTGEWAIRPYLNKYPKKSEKKMLEWAKDKNFHVRRLASEGIRINLPWAKKFDQYIDNPQPIIEIITLLKDDKSKYVQKSVANSINDLLKVNYAVAIDLLKKWSKNPSKQCLWIIKHALRNLIKKEDKEALQILSRIK